MMVITKITADSIVLLQLLNVGILKVYCTTETSGLPRYEDLINEICPLIENHLENDQPPSYADSIRNSLRIIEVPYESVLSDLGEHIEPIRTEDYANEKGRFCACIFIVVYLIVISITIGLTIFLYLKRQ